MEMTAKTNRHGVGRFGPPSPHPSWCAGGDEPDHEHHSRAVTVDGTDALVVELAMDPESDVPPRITILPGAEDGGVLGVELGQALALSRVLRRLVTSAQRAM
jgi:hypothetical protein